MAAGSEPVYRDSQEEAQAFEDQWQTFYRAPISQLTERQIRVGHRHERSTWRYTSLKSLQEDSPSWRRHHIDWETEMRWRTSGVDLIFQVADHLNLPHDVKAYASFYYHRYFTRASYHTNDRLLLAGAALLIACKSCSNWRSLTHVSEAYQVVRAKKIRGEDWIVHDKKAMSKVREYLTDAERVLLFDLAFDVNINGPLPLPRAAKDAQNMGLDVTSGGKHFPLLNTMRAVIERSYKCTVLCLTHAPEAIAAALLSFCADRLKLPLNVPDGKAFVDFTGTTEQAFNEALEVLRSMYQGTNPGDPTAPATTAVTKGGPALGARPRVGGAAATTSQQPAANGAGPSWGTGAPAAQQAPAQQASAQRQPTWEEGELPTAQQNGVQLAQNGVPGAQQNGMAAEQNVVPPAEHNGAPAAEQNGMPATQPAAAAVPGRAPSPVQPAAQQAGAPAAGAVGGAADVSMDTEPGQPAVAASAAGVARSPKRKVPEPNGSVEDAQEQPPAKLARQASDDTAAAQDFATATTSSVSQGQAEKQVTQQPAAMAAAADAADTERLVKASGSGSGCKRAREGTDAADEPAAAPAAPAAAPTDAAAAKRRRTSGEASGPDTPPQATGDPASSSPSAGQPVPGALPGPAALTAAMSPAGADFAV